MIQFISSSQTIFFNCLRPDLFHLLKRTMKWCFNSFHSSCFWVEEITLWEHLNHAFLFVIVSRFLLLMFKSWSFRLDAMWAKSRRPTANFFFHIFFFLITDYSNSVDSIDFSIWINLFDEPILNLKAQERLFSLCCFLNKMSLKHYLLHASYPVMEISWSVPCLCAVVWIFSNVFFFRPMNGTRTMSVSSVH